MNLLLQRAWDKHGCSNFIFYVIEKCSKDKLDEVEKYWIDFYGTFGMGGEFGYNLTNGGEGTSGYKLSEKTKEKMSLWQRNGNSPRSGTSQSKETKIKISNSNKGKIVSEETKNKMSKSAIGRKKQNSASKYYGVVYNNGKRVINKWRIHISIRGRYLTSSSYKTELEAALAYDKYVLENNLNMPLNFTEKEFLEKLKLVA